MTIAVFGGSFDPPHIGHVQIVKQIEEVLHVNKIYIVPTYLNPFKNSFKASESRRFSWLQKLFKQHKNIEILDYEIKQKRAVPTIETVEFLKKSYNIEKIYLVIGADNFLHVKKWHRYNELKELVEIVVASRDKVNLPKDLKKLSINVNISSSELREHLDLSYIPQTIRDSVKENYAKDKND